MCACFLNLSCVLPNNFCPICSTNLVHTSLEASLKWANVYAQLSSLENEGVYSQDQICFLQGVLVLKQPNEKSSTNKSAFNFSYIKEEKIFFPKEDFLKPVLQNEKNSNTLKQMCHFCLAFSIQRSLGYKTGNSHSSFWSSFHF